MYGGVAKSFVNFEFLCQPFKENNVYYIRVRNPKTKTERKVRFYPDKAHADLMPKGFNSAPEFWKIFGFKSKDDTILAIAEKDLTEEEVQKHFAYKWRFGTFYGGIWYAPEGTELPKIKNMHRYGYLTWEQLKKAGQNNSRRLGLVSEEASPWFQED